MHKCHLQWNIIYTSTQCLFWVLIKLAIVMRLIKCPSASYATTHLSKLSFYKSLTHKYDAKICKLTKCLYCNRINLMQNTVSKLTKHELR